MKWFQLQLFVYSVSFTSYSLSYKILILNPVGSKSLYYLTSSIGEALGDAGNQIVLLNSFSNRSSHENMTFIHTGTNDSTILEEVNVFRMLSFSQMFNFIKNANLKIGKSMWNNPEVKSLYQRRNDFDSLIIVGYANEIAIPFLKDFKGVRISICTPGIEPYHLSMYGNWAPFSVVPQMFLPYDEYMSFFERAINPIVFYFTMRLYYFTIAPPVQKLLDEYFPDLGAFDEIYWNHSLMLINGHHAMDSAVPLLPNQVEIGTINAKEPKKLPHDILEFIEKSEVGLVYFNLGSFARSVDLPKEYTKMLISAFEKLPHIHFLWKYESDDLKLPSNVMTKKWMPQQDILGHPKTLVFMSHCGNLGTQEAKYHGVPVLALPILFDQHRNAARLVRQGYGLQLNWETFTVEDVVNSINSLINQKKYQKKLDDVSKILHDQKESPAERTVWWVEYVIRHNGAPHMIYPGKHLHYLQYVQFDVFVFWMAVLFIIVFLCKKILKIMKNILCGRKIVKRKNE